MPVLTYPKFGGIKYFNSTDVFLAADSDSVTQYCTENGYSLSSYIPEDQRFSNDGALTYQYYSGGKWVLEFGFKRIVASITYS